MNIVSIEKFRMLADKNDWSPEYSQGYVDGEAFRKRGKQPSQFPLVGVDDYSLGFRAGYFERQGRISAGGERPEAKEERPALSGQRLNY